MIAAASESCVGADASDVARAKMCVWQAGVELQIAPLHFDLSCVEHTQCFILSVAVAGLRTRDIHSLESDPSAACLQARAEGRVRGGAQAGGGLGPYYYI